MIFGRHFQSKLNASSLHQMLPHLKRAVTRMDRTKYYIPPQCITKENNNNCDLLLLKEGKEPPFIRVQASASQPIYSLFNVSYLKVHSLDPFSQSLCCHFLLSVFQTFVQQLWQKMEDTFCQFLCNVMITN